MNKLLLALPVFAAALVLAAPVTHAFTFEDQSPANPPTSGPINLEDQVRGFANGTTTTEPGSSGLRFSVGPSSGPGLSNRFDSPPAWVGNPLFLDKGSSRDQ